MFKVNNKKKQNNVIDVEQLNVSCVVCHGSFYYKRASTSY